ncbi:MAG: glycosyltransferase family 4 protein [Schwartzia sp.]|nr:glycosyltransferase family 4 protein [Schwartzia sp. (in: firmicutes)]
MARGIYSLAPRTGWANFQITKNTGVLPFLFHKLFGFRSVMVGTKIDDYNQQKFVPGLELDFLPDAGEQTKLRYIEAHRDEMDVLLLHGPDESYFPVVEHYKRIRPDGKVYLELDLNSYSAERVDCASPAFLRFISSCDVVVASCCRIQKYISARWPCVVDCLMNGFFNLGGVHLMTPREYIDTYESRENVILSVGRIGNKEKNNEELLEAFARLGNDAKDFRVRLVGPVEEGFAKWLEGDFLARFPRLGDRVELSGAIYDKKKLMREYQRAKIFVISSPLEGGTPNVAAEALHGGCSMVTSDIDAAQEVIDGGKCGDMYEHGDVDALARVLCSQISDEERLIGNGLHAIEYAHAKFDFEKIARHAYYLLYGEAPR